MARYVVIEPNIMWHAFGGCYEVDHETKDTVFYKVSDREGGFFIKKVSRKRVLFFTDQDISSKLKEQNSKYWVEHEEYEKRIFNTLGEFRKQYSVQEAA